MSKRVAFLVVAAVVGIVAAAGVVAQVQKFVPVTRNTLLKPSPDNWMMISRTYDGQRSSPLQQITRQNVNGLRLVWKQELGEIRHESVPIVYDGVMYVPLPGGVVRALNAATGARLWEYRRTLPAGVSQTASKTKSLALFFDMVYFTAPDGYLIALDAQTGKVRWEVKTGQQLQDTSGPLVVDGMVITGRTCNQRADCFVSANDAESGREVWKFQTVTEPGTWRNTDVKNMGASPWGLMGSYDPDRHLIYWGVANVTPNTRLARRGTPDLEDDHAPSDLYSNSTIALNSDTGKLAWYYQHLPGDDWDEDFNEDKILLRTPISPDPQFVKWINPDIARGEARDVVVTIGEGGGMFVNDRVTGQFLWATPFPYDDPNFLIRKIDVKTGITYINTDLIMKFPGDHHTICFWNTRNYWPNSYLPGLNSLYVPFTDNCLEMTAASPGKPEIRNGLQRATNLAKPSPIRSDPNTLGGIMKINMATGEFTRIYSGRLPGNGASLTTSSNLLFWGDLDQVFRAFDAESGKILWETRLDGPIQMSTITYGVNGKQYVSVMTGEGAITTAWMFDQLGIKSPSRHYSAIYTFALP